MCTRNVGASLVGAPAPANAGAEGRHEASPYVRQQARTAKAAVHATNCARWWNDGKLAAILGAKKEIPDKGDGR